jgi:glycosyltransferase involved in cell wall biosynthesis
MPLTLGERLAPSNPLASEGRPSDVSPGTAETVVMLVTNEGLSDPRVRRSIHTARQAGYGVRLVCRTPSSGKPAPGMSDAIDVHRVARPWGWLRLRQLFAKRHRASTVEPTDRPGARAYWIRPWELWILGGISWFTLQAVAKVRRFPAKLYHANDLDTLPAAVILSCLNNTPLLYDAHELFSDQFNRTSRQFSTILFGLERWLIRFADKVVTVNHSMAETLAAWHKIPLPSVVLNCPFAVEVVRPRPDGLGDSSTRTARLIYQGIFMRDRGLEELIRSAAWYESAELYLRGYGALEGTLRALVKAEHLENRVYFLPPVAADRLVESMAGFDVGLIPYRATSLNNRLCLPNKIFEYLQAGLALAVSALPEMERVVKETGAGEVFNPDQPRDIARAVNAVTGEASRLAELKGRARAAAQRYTWEAQGAPQLLACYRELAGPAFAARRSDH